MLYLGVDPGKTGAWVFIDDVDEVFEWGMNSEAPRFRELVRKYRRDGEAIKGCLELVHAFRKQGIASAFTFGKEVGKWEDRLETLEIPAIQVTPQKWQKAVLDFLPARQGKANQEDEKSQSARRASNKKLIKGAVLDFVRRQYLLLSALHTKETTAKEKEALADAICLARYARLKSRAT